MNILMGTPLFSFFGDAGHYWLRAFQELGHRVYVWDYRLDPWCPENLGEDLSIVFKGDGIKRLPASPRVCYWPDALDRDPGVESYLAQFDQVFTPVWPAPVGIPLPSGWEPLIHRDLGIPRHLDKVYIGTCNSSYKRQMVLDIWPNVIAGNGWDDLCYLPIQRLPPQYLGDFTNLANRAKVLVDVHHSPQWGINRKLFEMVACGPTVFDRVPGVDGIFDDVVMKSASYTTAAEAQEVTQRLLADDDLRTRIWALERKAILPYSYTQCAFVMLERWTT